MQDFYESINTLIARGKIKSQLKKEKKLALLEVTIFFYFRFAQDIIMNVAFSPGALLFG